MHRLVLGGLIGSVLFSIVVLVAAELRQDYSHAGQFISELGATGTSNAALMNYAGFVPAGIALVAFGVGLATTLPHGRLTLLAAVLVAMFGSGVTASGVISCDPGCPQVGGSLANSIHDKIGPLSFLCLIAASGTLGVRFRSLPAWRGLSLYSLLTSALALGFLVALATSLETRVLTGLWQRLLLIALFVWCAVISLRAFHSSRSPAVSQTPK